MPHFNDLRVTWQVPHKRYWLPAVPTALLWARNLTEQSRYHLKHYVASTTMSCNKKQVVRTLNQGQMYQGCPWRQRVWTQVFFITKEVPHHQTLRHKRLGDPNFLWQRRTPVQPEMPNVGSESKWGGDWLATCLGAEESQSLPASCSPSKCANHRAAARSG